jgi:hypothetical protein
MIYRIGKTNFQNIKDSLHFGDEIITVNDKTIKSIDSFVKDLKKSNGHTEIKIKLKRLPFGRLISISNISLDFSNNKHTNHLDMIKEIFGIKLKEGTAKIEKIEERGLLFQYGLKYDPNKVEFDLKTKSLNTISKSDERNRLTKWIITNINGDFINYECSAKEV